MQRAIEKRAIPAVSITVARDVTEHAKPPRTVFLPFMMGHQFGVPFTMNYKDASFSPLSLA